MNELTVQIFEWLMNPRAVFIHHEASLGRETDRLDHGIVCPRAVRTEAEQVGVRLDQRHVSLADDGLAGILVVIRVDNHLKYENDQNNIVIFFA